MGIGIGGAVTGFTWSKHRKTYGLGGLPDLANWRMEAFWSESQFSGITLDCRFEVVEVVARGGFATIFKGKDRQDSGRACAIKIFRKELADDQWLTRRFQQEVSALEQIRHPAVVSFLGHGIAPGGAPYLAMEFIEGGTLRDRLATGPVPPRRCAGLLRQAAGALEQIHARGIYHRDLKPENLMLRAGAIEGEELVLIDFSIAIVKGRDQTIHGLSRAAGTICYMAPEQVFGIATPASDVYSLAKVVLEMLTARRLDDLLPWAGMDLPERASELARGLPIGLSAESIGLLGLALHYEPSRRPQTIQELVQPIVRDLSA